MNISEEHEYNTLRNEILNEMQMQTNLRIAMVTVSIAVLSFAFENESSTLFMLNFIVIIMFRLLIHSKQFGILKLSAYIIVRFERNCRNLKWESVSLSHSLIEKSKISFYKIRNGGYYFASMLGIITIILYVYDLKLKDDLCWFNIIMVCAGIIVILFLDFAFDNKRIRERYIKEFEKML